MKDPYQVLGIPKTANLSQIKSAFRRLAKETHPDVNEGVEKSSKRFKEVAEAYAILSDIDKKKAYDDSLRGKTDLNYSSMDFDEIRITAENIEIYIRNLYREVEPYKAQAIKHLVIGLLWFFGGCLISLFSYSASLENGLNSYTVFYGAIFFGGLLCFSGILITIKYINKGNHDNRYCE